MSNYQLYQLPNGEYIDPCEVSSVAIEEACERGTGNAVLVWLNNKTYFEIKAQDNSQARAVKDKIVTEINTARRAFKE